MTQKASVSACSITICICNLKSLYLNFLHFIFSKRSPTSSKFNKTYQILASNQKIDSIFEQTSCTLSPTVMLIRPYTVIPRIIFILLFHFINYLCILCSFYVLSIASCTFTLILPYFTFCLLCIVIF